MKDLIEEDLQNFSEEDLDEEKGIKPTTKRFLIIALAVALVFLMASTVIVQWPIGDILAGQFRSKSLQGNVLHVDDVTVYLEGNSLNMVLKSFTDNREVETALCLEGIVDGNEYYIIKAYEPIIYEQTYTHVLHESCSQDTVILFHTHPYKHCLASQTDLNTLKNRQSYKPESITIVMCEENRFSLYT